MTTSLRTRISSAVIFFVLIASAVFTVPARADSGSPPPAPTAPGGTNHSAAQVPSGGTNTSGGGDQGHKVELSSQNAAYVAPAGDPVWCPSSMGVPTPGSGACSTNYGDMATLITYLTGNQKTVDGTIWINGGGPDVSGPNTMDGSVAFATMALHKLTLKGGWTGIGGSINTNNPSLFSNTLNIINWGRDITLNDVQFNNVVGSPGEGLNISTSGNITLTRVQANNDQGSGGYLDNTSGIGTITITNSQFNHSSLVHDIYSLEVHSNNAITLMNVIANNGYGVKLANNTASNKPVTIKSSNFDNNSWNGLTVVSMGAITLINVSASGNYLGIHYGAQLDNHNSSTAAPVTLIGTNIFDSNAGYGLYVFSKGKITSATLNASNNGGYGATFDNSLAITALLATLTGNSTFNGNTGDGLDVYSRGVITTKNLFADGNGGNGAYLQNNFSLTSPVKVTGTNIFTKNGLTGLLIDSIGAISLNNITADGNGTTFIFDGLRAENLLSLTPQSITLTGVNEFNKNTKDGAILFASGMIKVGKVNAMGNANGIGLGLENSHLGIGMPQSVTILGPDILTNNFHDNLDIATYGTISITNLNASNSVGGDGAFLGISIPVPGNVTLKGTNTFNNNGANGLLIKSSGTVLTNGLIANSNVSNGVAIDNRSSTIFSPVKLNGINTFNFNGGGGLAIDTYGALVANGLTAISNNDDGASIDNSTSGIPAPVTLKGINTFNNNAVGLDIASNGAVVTNGLSASSNHITGVSIDNNYANIVPVTLKGLSTFNLNSGLYGLNIHSNGAVLTNGLIATTNHGDGVYIDNSFSSFTAPVTLKGINNFNSNTAIGLAIKSNGGVLATGLSAINNQNIGVLIHNSLIAVAPVTLNGINTFNFNGVDGLEIVSNGAVVTNGLIAMNNGNNGVKVDNSSSSISAPVTLKGINTFNNNILDGLYVASNGAVVTNHLIATNNQSHGGYIDNSSSTTFAPVTLNGLNTFSNNSSNGLFLFTKGLVTTNNLTVSNNGSAGAYVLNDFLGAFAGINLKGNNVFFDNGGDGIDLYSSGPVTVTNISSKLNFDSGIFVDTPASVTVSCGKFISNGTSHGPSGYGWYTGIDVSTIKLIGVTTAGNFSGDSHSNNPGISVVVVPHPCSLP